MNQIQVSTIADGVHFNSVRDSRFKTMRISASIIVPLSADTASAYALLAGVLARSCKAYPDFTALSKRLSYLYGADLAVSVHKVGDRQIINLSAAGLDDRYTIDGESISRELSLLLCGAIFEPNLTPDGVFVDSEVEQERRQLLDLIASEFNEKRTYALGQMIRHMCDGERFGVKRYGTAEQIQALTAQDLVDAWQMLLRTAAVEIVYISETAPDKAIAVFTEAFSRIDRAPAAIESTLHLVKDEVKTFTDEMELSQSKLVMGFAADKPIENHNAVRMMCAVLGGTPSSKLFNNVREKQSLCYYCASRYDRHKGIMTVDSGVESANIEKTRDAILKEFEDMKNGVISDYEIETAKLAVVNFFRSSNDTVSGIEGWYSSQLFDGAFRSIGELSDEINAVTKDEIVAAANSLRLDTVYILKGMGVAE